MARITALELINRVMLLRRQPVISAYESTNPEHVATLNVLNMAKEDLLSTRRPEFDLRHDGQIVTRPTHESLEPTVTATFTATATDTSGIVVLTGYTANVQLTGDSVVRLVPTGDTDYSATAFRISTYFPSFTQATLNFPFAMPKAFVGVECDLIYAEYLLPDTVREVVRASYEQEPLSLNQIDATARFDEIYPSYTYETGEPRSFNVGGFDTATHLTTEDPDPKLRAIIWPIPDDEYVLTYSYYYRHPDFTDGDSELIGVPPEFVNDIVKEAYATMTAAWDGNMDGLYFSDMAQRASSVKSNIYSGSSARRHTIHSWGEGEVVGNQEGFPGKMLGPT